MAKLALTPNSTFVVPVDIHTPGNKPAAVKFTFNHLSAREFDAFGATYDENRAKEPSDKTKRPAGEFLKTLIAGWDLDAEFNEANLIEFFDNYWNAEPATLQAYVAEMNGARRGN